MLRHRNEYPVEGQLPPFDGATAWLNSGSVTADALRGRVVLVSFGTYTCINWIRTLPYVRAWADKYAGQGLVVIGVQTPEFDFEKDLDGVRIALKAMNVSYPVAVDNDYAVWQAFDNHYWPALYFVDGQGRIRHHRFGEGDYQESERVLQMLLAEAGADVDHPLGATRTAGRRTCCRLGPPGLRRRTMSATSAPRGSPHRAVRCPTSPTGTPRLRRWGATNGRCLVTGASGRSPPSWRSRAAESPSPSTPAT